MCSAGSAAAIRHGGLPHSEISGSKLECSSPERIAAYRVLHRPPAPRHPPRALRSLNTKTPRYQDTTKANQQQSNKAEGIAPKGDTPSPATRRRVRFSLYPQLHWTHCHALSYKRDVTMRLLVVPRPGKTQKKARNVTLGKRETSRHFPVFAMQLLRRGRYSHAEGHFP
jgi:hypothetical protein